MYASGYETGDSQHQQVSSVALLARARSLRARATGVNPLLASAYLRRAAELRMEAWARDVHHSRATPDDVDDLTAPAAA